MKKRSLLYRNFPRQTKVENEAAAVRPRAHSRRSASLSRHHQIQKSVSAGFMSPSRLAVLVDDYLTDCATAHSTHTIQKRRIYLTRMVQFLRERNYEQCGQRELKEYFASLRNLSTGEPLRPVTLDTMRRDTVAFWNWLIEHNYAHDNPVLDVRKPQVKTDQTPPLSEDQIRALVATARRSFFAPRDTAVILFLLDTGVRASELCGLRICDVDFQHKTALVMGKGNKKRTVYFTTRTQNALYCYLEGRLPVEGVATDHLNGAVFLAETGKSIGEPLTRRGVYQLVQRLIEKAGIKGTKKGPHLLRHSFVYHFFRNGGQQQTAMLLLGHEDPKMTHHYNKMADADCQESARKYSPVEGMKL